MIALGERVGDGVRAVIYRVDDEHVVKMPKPSTDAEWIGYEARFTRIVHQCGAPTPAESRTVEIDGEVGLLSSYVPGPTLWEALADEPTRAEELGQLLADLQRRLFTLPPTAALPDLSERLGAKLWTVARVLDLDLESMRAWISRGGTRGLCHGDLHPHNVILASIGPVVVDWFDVANGVAAAEIARTVVLLNRDRTAPGVADLQRSYLAAARRAGYLVEKDFSRWMLVQRTVQLAEGFGFEPTDAIRRQIVATDWT